MLLADATELTLVVAGRSLANAQAFCAPLKAAATLVPAVFDRAGDVKGQLRDIKPDVVVDSAGPFQLYGSDPYRVVRAAIEQGIHYIDLSDGAAFVDGIVQFDAAARDRGVFILSGASSFPVLTAAVVRRLMAPAGTPAGVVAKISAETGRVLKLPEIQTKLGSQGLYAVPSTPAQFDAHIKSETARYAKIVKEAGIKAD